MGDVTLDTKGQEKEAAKDGLYYSVSYSEKENEVIVKIVNSNDGARAVRLRPDDAFAAHKYYRARTLTAAGDSLPDHGLPGSGRAAHRLPEAVSVTDSDGAVSEEILLPEKSFTVVRF